MSGIQSRSPIPTPFVRIAAVLLTASTVHGSGHAETLSGPHGVFEPIDGEATGVRTQHSAIRVPSTDRVIVFGGHNNDPYVMGCYNNVLSMQLGTQEWVVLSPSGTPPTPRGAHTAVYDPLNHRMLVYGGRSEWGGSANAELWSLSLSDTPEWSLLTPSGTSPGPRAGHSATLDPVRNRMILFGGAGIGGNDGVYALSLTGPLVWQQLTVAGSSPGGRNNHSAVYDPVRDQMVLFGGLHASSWVLSLGASPAWTPLFPTGPVPTEYIRNSMIYDSYRDRFVIYGGGSNYQVSKTYALSLVGGAAFTELTPAGPIPPVRSGAASVYDPVRDLMFVHGGQYDGGTTVHFARDDAFALVWGENVSVPSTTGSRSAVGSPGTELEFAL